MNFRIYDKNIYFDKKSALRIATGILVIALLSGNGAIAATIIVPDNYAKIQWAIDNATAGDTIEVHNSTYYETVNVNKKLTLRGIGNPVVDARGSASAITLAADGITLVGFTATRGGSDSAAGIKVISNNNTLMGNNAANNRYGVYLHSSKNNTLMGNNAANNRYGIYLYSSKNNTISGNTANSNNYDGILLYSSSNNNTLIGNNVSSNGYGILVHSSSNDNTLLGNNALNNYEIGIGLWYSCNNNTLSGNNASNNQVGIYLDSSSNNQLRNNNALNNYGDGLGLFSSSNNNTLLGNNASNNDYGIYLDSSRSNMLIGNNVKSNNVIGIVLGESGNNTLIDNDAYSNKGTGISLRSSGNNILIGSNVSNNGYYGISLHSSSSNKMYHNNIKNNTNQAQDDTNTNSWDTGYPSGGNYWGDYKGFDTKSGSSQDQPGSDGIGDTPYNIDGSAGAKDVYPYMIESGWVKPVDLSPVAICGPDKLKCENAVTKVQFNGNASYDPDGNISSYGWEFGDGTNGTGVAPNHTYAAYRWNGTAYQSFTVNLTITDNVGSTNKTSQKVVIWMAGDVNGDGKVNILDASVVGLKWNGNDPCADLNNDGVVNILDASIIGSNWGKQAIIVG